MPPTYFNIFLILAIGLHFILPIKRVIHSPYTYLGLILISLGVVLNVWSVGTLKGKNTTIDFHGTPQRLVTDGPFHISRNPAYLGGIILSLGVAVLLGSLITFVFPIVLVLILDKLYIPSEEKSLEELFSEEYLKYKRRVRRWI